MPWHPLWFPRKHRTQPVPKRRAFLPVSGDGFQSRGFLSYVRHHEPSIKYFGRLFNAGFHPIFRPGGLGTHLRNFRLRLFKQKGED